MPAAFDGIERALRSIERHVAAGGRITVHGDYDVDGVCATAIMVRALRALGADVGWFLPEPDRGRLRPGGRDRASGWPQRGTGLLVTVDCGDHRGRRGRRRRGRRGWRWSSPTTMRRAPTACCPTARSCIPASCGYPCPELCGTGGRLQARAGAGRAGPPSEDLELVALATVADLVPLVGENRRLVREGLAALAGTAKPGLRALMAVARADPSALDAAGARLPPGAADQRRRAAAPGRCRARAAADRGRRARAGRSPPSSTRSTPSAGRSSSGSCGRPRRQVAELGPRAALRAVRPRTGTRA